MKIYYNINSDNYYTFKFFFQDILVVSGIKPNNKIGNKRKSGKIEIIFMNSYYIHSSTGKTSRKPELNLWEEYLESFSISKEMLIKWLDQFNGFDSYCRLLRELKNKIKDEQL